MVEIREVEPLFVGILPYGDGLELQNRIHFDVLEGIKADTVIFCEHNHVYTFGKSATGSNLLITEDFLKSIKAESFQTERGGDVTYHGPGQLVGYPIVNLSERGLGVKRYVELMEESLIATLGTFGLEAYRIDGLTGIWVGPESDQRKIGAIGIRVKKGVSMHGFALNVNTDLNYFNHIIPCGIQDKGVTSLKKEGVETTVDAFAQRFFEIFKMALAQ